LDGKKKELTRKKTETISAKSVPCLRGPQTRQKKSERNLARGEKEKRRGKRRKRAKRRETKKRLRDRELHKDEVHIHKVIRDAEKLSQKKEGGKNKKTLKQP